MTIADDPLAHRWARAYLRIQHVTDELWREWMEIDEEWRKAHPEPEGYGWGAELPSGLPVLLKKESHEED